MALQFSSMGPMDTYQPQKHPKQPRNDSLSVTEHFCKKIKFYFLYGLTSCSTVFEATGSEHLHSIQDYAAVMTKMTSKLNKEAVNQSIALQIRSF